MATIFVAGNDWQNLSMQWKELKFLHLQSVMAKYSLVVSYERQPLNFSIGHIGIVQPQYDSLIPIWEETEWCEVWTLPPWALKQLDYFPSSTSVSDGYVLRGETSVSCGSRNVLWMYLYYYFQILLNCF